MKRTLTVALLVLLTGSLFAQKTVRRAIKNGNSAYNEQRYSAAEAAYADALEENEASKEASFNLANSYYKQDRYDEALKEYDHYLKLEQEDLNAMSSAWSNIGNTYLKKKANEKAEAAAMQQAAQSGQPGQPQAKQQQQDNLQLSMAAYKNALRLNPKDDETRENLAIVQKVIQDQEKDEDGGGGGGSDDKDQNQDQDKQDQDNKDDKQDQKEDKQDQGKPDKQDQQQDGQMSQENIQQILDAIEQDERDTQNKVNQIKANERKKQSERNRLQDKDW